MSEPSRASSATGWPTREGPIPSRWQHQELPAWRRVSPEVVCEVRFSHVDGRGFDSRQYCCVGVLIDRPMIAGSSS